MHPVYPDYATCAHRLKWRSTAEIAHAIEHPTRSHVASSRSLIAIDRTALIAPRHMRALNTLKIDIKLEISVFNSGNL